MELMFAAGLHNDPVSRKRCAEWVRELVAAKGPPHWVAAEWDSGIEAKLADFRSRFHEKWTRFRRKDPPGLVQQLAEAIAWEADVSDAVFDEDIPVIWLEDGREPLPSSRDLALGRWWDFQIALGPGARDCDPEEVLFRVHARAIEDAVSSVAGLRDGRDLSRDHRWAERISARVEEGWALIIVGAVHASKWDDETLFRLLEAAGHVCETRFLVWEPQASDADPGASGE